MPSSFSTCVTLATVSLCLPTLLADSSNPATSDIVWEAGANESDSNFEIEVDAEEGLNYLIQSSTNLVDWTDLVTFRGVGITFTHPLFALPDKVNTVSSETVVAEGEPPRSVSLRMSRLWDDANNNVGIILRWISPIDESPKVYVVHGTILHESFPPVYFNTHNGFSYSVVMSNSSSAVPQSDELVGEDSDIVGTWISQVPIINEMVEQQVITTASHPPLAPDPNAKKFYRVQKVTVDSDSDGLLDHIEAQNGTDYYNNDSDGDGVLDGQDATPLVNDAIADPDGANLDSSLKSGLLARWDFERSSGKSGLEDASGNHRSLALVNQSSSQSFTSLGMISSGSSVTSGHFSRRADFLKDTQYSWSTALRSDMSVSFWIKPEEELIRNSNSRLGIWNIAYYNAYNSQDINGYWRSWVHSHTYGIHVQRNINGDELWVVGQDTFRNDHDSNPSSYYLVDPIAANPATGAIDGNELKWTMPAGSSDSGKWKHVTLVRENGRVGNFFNGRTAVYVDGALVAEAPLKTWHLQNTAQWNASNMRVVIGQHTASNNVATQFKGCFDRMRVYSKALSASQISKLYNQDIDADGLFDRTEQKTLLWRDKNGDGERTEDEQSYTANPFYNDPPTTDHDGDGLTSLEEQNIYQTSLADPDSDNDLMPDGWEVTHNLNPLSAADAHMDSEGDGVSNINEYIHASDPHRGDSDDDGISDFIEMTQGSLAGSGNDNGEAPSADDYYSVLLGVGDHSSSESEDYVLNVFELDPVTEAEKQIYTLRSGGHGEYKEETKHFFRKDRAYSFQIDWQSTNSQSSSDENNAEGADFDYTLKVEPQGNPKIIEVGAYSPSTRMVHPDMTITGVKDNVRNFPNTTEKKRVLLTPFVIEEFAPNTGFDDYQRYDEALNHPLPWLSIPTSNKCIIKSLAPVQGVALEASAPEGREVTVTPTHLNSKKEVVTIAYNGPWGEGEVSFEGTLKIAGHDALNFVVYRPRERTVAVHLISLTNDDEDTLEIKEEQGLPNTKCIGIGTQSNYLKSVYPGGDDEIREDGVYTGPDGIRQTEMHPDDKEIIGMGKGLENQVFIRPGDNGVLNTPVNNILLFDANNVIVKGDDMVVGETIHTGANGIRETEFVKKRIDPAPITQAVLQAKFDEVFKKQTNIAVNITSFQTHAIDYDRGDRDGRDSEFPILKHPNGLFDYRQDNSRDRTYEEVYLESQAFDEAANFNIYFFPTQIVGALNIGGSMPYRVAYPRGYARSDFNTPFITHLKFKHLYPTYQAGVAAHELGHNRLFGVEKSGLVHPREADSSSPSGFSLNRDTSKSPSLKRLDDDLKRLMTVNPRNDTPIFPSMLIKEEWDKLNGIIK